jgi:hypothetical protein
VEVDDGTARTFDCTMMILIIGIYDYQGASARRLKKTVSKDTVKGPKHKQIAFSEYSFGLFLLAPVPSLHKLNRLSRLLG